MNLTQFLFIISTVLILMFTSTHCCLFYGGALCVHHLDFVCNRSIYCLKNCVSCPYATEQCLTSACRAFYEQSYSREYDLTDLYDTLDKTDCVYVPEGEQDKHISNEQ